MTEGIGTTCGNCGKPVAVSDVICPNCDVLLAAYQSPSGSAIGGTLATAPVTETYVAPPPPAAIPVPTAASIPPAAPVPTSAPVATPIATIQPAPSALRSDNSARPTSVTASPSSRSIADELSDMARDKSSFAESISADLKEAKVVFDDESHGQIETAPSVPNVDVSNPVTDQEAPNLAPALGEAPDPNRKLNPPRPPRVPSLMNANQTSISEGSSAAPVKNRNNVVAVIVVVFAIAFVFRNPNSIIFLLVALGLGFFFFRTAIRASKSNSRTTSRMPKDKNTRR